jgi:hypothetical protein
MNQPMNQSIRNRAFQFSLAWLVFWTFVCALAAGLARLFIESGQEGQETLICFAALGVWLAMTFVAIYLRIFLQRRWDRAAAMRNELELLVKHRRAEGEGPSDQATSSPEPGP